MQVPRRAALRCRGDGNLWLQGARPHRHLPPRGTSSGLSEMHHPQRCLLYAGKSPHRSPGALSAPDPLVHHVRREGSAPCQAHTRQGRGVAITSQPPHHPQGTQNSCHSRGEQPELLVKPGHFQHESQEHGEEQTQGSRGSAERKGRGGESQLSSPSRGVTGLGRRQGGSPGAGCKAPGCLGTPRALCVPLDTAGSCSTEGKVTEVAQSRQRGGEGYGQAIFF